MESENVPCHAHRCASLFLNLVHALVSRKVNERAHEENSVPHCDLKSSFGRALCSFQTLPSKYLYYELIGLN